MSNEKCNSDDLSCEKSTGPASNISSHKVHNKIKPKIKIARNPPSLEIDTWKRFDLEFSIVNKDSWTKLIKGELPPDKYIDQLNVELASFLKSKKKFNTRLKNSSSTNRRRKIPWKK